MSGSVYPGAIDSFTDPTASNNLSDPSVLHSTQHAQVNDAVNAIETTLGTNPQGTYATVGARLAADEGFVLRGTGSPYGVVTPSAAGVQYTDTNGTNGAWSWMSTGTTSTSWVVVMGDTGDRQVTTLINGPASSSYFYIRRIGSLVQVSMNATFATGWTAGNILFSLPAGFIPVKNLYPSEYSTLSPLSIVSGNAALWSSPPANASRSWAFTYATVNSWPTTLPGVPG